MDSVDDHRAMKELRIKLHPLPPLDSDGEDDEQAAATVRESRRHHPAAAAAAASGNSMRRLLSKQLSMRETSREIKWEKRRRQIQRQGSMVVLQEGRGGRARPQTARCLTVVTDEDLDELRGSFELGFGFDEETGGADLRDTLPALDLYFAVNRQLSDPKLRSLAASPTSTLSATSSSSTLSDTPSPRSPHGSSPSADPWKIFSPGDNPQLIKTRLRHWAQVVACSVKHGC